MRVPPWNLDLEWTFLESFYLHVIRDTIVLPLYWSQEFHNHRSYSCPTSRLFYLSLCNTKMWYYNIALSTKPHTTVSQYACWWMQTEYEKRKQVSSNFNFFHSFRTESDRVYTPLAKRQESHWGKLVFLSVWLILFAACGVLQMKWKTWAKEM